MFLASFSLISDFDEKLLFHVLSRRYFSAMKNLIKRNQLAREPLAPGVLLPRNYIHMHERLTCTLVPL